MTTTLAEIRARWYEQGPAELTRMQVSRDAFRLLEIVDALTAERDVALSRVATLEARVKDLEARRRMAALPDVQEYYTDAATEANTPKEE